ncbi:MAG TPA: class I SAM-dependent methyltransferase [Chloroflexia bacterium]
MTPIYKALYRRFRKRFFGKPPAQRTWHKDGDTAFLLRGLSYSPVRLCITQGSSALNEADLSPDELEVVRHVTDHPGCTIPDIAQRVSSVRPYTRSRSLVLRLVSTGALRPCGRAPLESVDRRYERVPACAVCGASSQGHKTLFWKYGTPIVRCDGCGLLYANPRWNAEELFGRYTPEYWEQYAGTISDTAVDAEANYARWRPFLEVVEASRHYNRLLDVGCATGEFLLAARTREWEVYGVETSPPAAAQAERLAGGTVHAGTLETSHFPEAYFDVITMWDVIEHLQDPRAYLQKAHSLLRPEGLLSITTPNIRSLAYRLLGPDWTPVGPNDHLYYFAPRTLARLLDECGFSIYVMHTMATELATWHQWLPHPALHRFAPRLRALSLPLTNRFLLGDTLYLVAQRRP